MAEGDVLLILEAMKMETEIRAAQAGTVRGPRSPPRWRATSGR
ncbi:biotin/lipoyl-containing protein [Salmonella enterica]